MTAPAIWEVWRVYRAAYSDIERMGGDRKPFREATDLTLSAAMQMAQRLQNDANDAGRDFCVKQKRE